MFVDFILKIYAHFANVIYEWVCVLGCESLLICTEAACYTHQEQRQQQQQRQRQAVVRVRTKSMPKCATSLAIELFINDLVHQLNPNYTLTEPK